MYIAADDIFRVPIVSTEMMHILYIMLLIYNSYRVLRKVMWFKFCKPNIQFECLMIHCIVTKRATLYVAKYNGTSSVIILPKRGIFYLLLDLGNYFGIYILSLNAVVISICGAFRLFSSSYAI